MSARSFSQSAIAAAKVPFSRIYNGVKVTWLDQVHRSTQGDKMLDEFIDNNKADLESKNTREIEARSPVHPGEENENHLTLYGKDKSGGILDSMHLYVTGRMTWWPFSGKKR